MTRRTLALRSLPKLPFGFADVALGFGLFLLLYGLAHIGRGLFVEFKPPSVGPSISLDPWVLPYYAARSTLRMFVALIGSTLFSLAYGYLAAKNKRAEQIMVPLLDILQSVPVLGFLSVTVTGFVALFPGSLFGLELASIFAAFTGQAWNMTFAFYHSLITLPKELDEASTVFRLSKWRRFISLEVPSTMIPLVWNAMMSFGGGWFFVAVTEAIQIQNHQYSLPGIGAYVKKAVDEGNGQALLYASIAMILIVIIVDQLFWRPVVAWSEKFKFEQSASAEVPTSWVLDMIREAKLPRVLGRYWRRWKRLIRKIPWPKFQLRRRPAEGSKKREFRYGDQIFGAVLGGILVGAIWLGTKFVTQEVALREIGVAFYFGFLTFSRVVVLLVFCGLVWTPVGVWIGFHPRIARIAQPIVQICSSYPAYFLFPWLTVFFLRTGLSLNWGSLLLMLLGTQWYIVFNSIAGGMSVPTDLRDMATNMGLKGWKLWKKLILPAIFPAWVTGAITASGGAWNASIVAEIVQWKNTTLVASGLGAYIARASNTSDVPRVVLGVSVMCIFVVGVNRLFWHRLYHLAETRYRLG